MEENYCDDTNCGQIRHLWHHLYEDGTRATEICPGRAPQPKEPAPVVEGTSATEPV